MGKVCRKSCLKGPPPTEYIDQDRPRSTSDRPRIDLGSTKIDLGSTEIDPGSTEIDLGSTEIDLGSTKIDWDLLGSTEIDQGSTKIDQSILVDPSRYILWGGDLKMKMAVGLVPGCHWEKLEDLSYYIHTSSYYSHDNNSTVVDFWKNKSEE